MFRRIATALAVLIGAVGVVTAAGPLPARADVRPAAGQFVPVTPTRTVNGTSLAKDGTYTFSPLGTAGLPTSGVSAIKFQLSGKSTGGGWLVVFPAGATRPGASHLNYQANVLTTNAVVSALGTTNQVSIYNGAASQAIALYVDIVGYYTTASATTAGATYVPLTPARITNGVAVTAGGTVAVAPLGAGGVPTTNVAAVLGHLTISSAAVGSAVVYASGTARPGTTDLNYGNDPNYTNQFTTRLGADGKFMVYSSQAATVTIDVVGYYQKPAGTAAGGSFVGVTAARVINGVTVAGGSTTTYTIAGTGGVPASGALAVAMNLTATSATAVGALSVWAAGVARPNSRQLSYRVGAAWPTLQVSKLSTDGKISIYNSGSAAVKVIGDINGYYRAPAAPSVPSGVRALPGNGMATVSWSPPSVDGGASITSYTVTASPGGVTATATDGSTTVQVPGLTNGVPYTFTVTATNAAGTSASSAASSAVKPAPPAPPAQPYITDTVPRDGAVSVSWSPPPSGADSVTGYLVQATPGTAKVQVDGAQTQAVLTGLTNATAYRITVSAINGNGTGTASAPSQTVVPTPAQVPLKPEVTATIALSGRVDLQWVAPSDGGGDITGYTVTVNPGGRVIAIPAGTTVAAVTGLTNGTATTFDVAAVNAAGAGPATRVTATPVAARVPAAPGDIRASVTAAGQLTANWTAPIDRGTSAVTGYTVTATPGGATVSVGATATSAVLTGLAATTAYSLTVRALNAAGTGAPSAATDAVQPKVTMKVTPVILSAASAATLRSAQQDGTLQFEQPPVQVTGLRAGSLVVVTPNALLPQGFYGKVIQVGTHSGMFVVNTTPAGLDEAFTEGGLSSVGQLTTGDVTSFTPLAPGVRLAEPTIGGRTLKEGAAASASAADIGTPNVGIRDGALVLEYATEPKTDDRGISNRIELQTAIKPTFDNKLHFSLTGGLTGGFSVGGSTKSQVQSKVGYVAEWEMPRKNLATIRTTCMTVPIGLVPVVMCPEFTVGVALTIKAGGGYAISLSYDRSFAVGLNFDGGTVTPTASSQADGDPEQTVHIFGEAGVEAETPVSLIVYFYGAVGPEVNLIPYVSLFADTTQNPWWEVRAGLRINAAVVSPKIFGVKLDFQSDNLVNVFVTVARADGPWSGLKITPDDPRTVANEPLDLGYTIVGYPIAAVHWSVTKGPGTIDSDGVYTSSVSGWAEITAHVDADPLHPPMDATTKVLVGVAPPSAPRSLAATRGSFSATVSWQPPAKTNGGPITGYVATTQPPTSTTYFPAGATSGQVAGLLLGTSYLIQVAATNSAGTGVAGSTTEPIRPLDDSFLPIGTTPTNIAAADPSMSTIYWGEPVLSRTGRYVVFSINSTSPLAPIDLRGASPGSYLVREDLVTGEIVLVSRATDGATPVTAHHPSIDSSGTIVSYGVGAGATAKVLVNNLANGTVTDASTNKLTGLVYLQKISADGTTLVAWGQLAPDLHGSIWRTKIGSGTATQVSRCWVAYTCETGPYVESGKRLSISGDGRYILFAEDSPAPYLGNYLYDATSGAVKELPSATVDADDIEMSALSADATTTAGFVGSYTGTSGPYVKRGLTVAPTPTDAVKPVDLDGTEWIVPQLSDDGRVALIYHQSPSPDGKDGFSLWNQGVLVDIPVSAQYASLSGDGRVVALLRENLPGIWLQRLS